MHITKQAIEERKHIFRSGLQERIYSFVSKLSKAFTEKEFNSRIETVKLLRIFKADDFNFKLNYTAFKVAASKWKNETLFQFTDKELIAIKLIKDKFQEEEKDVFDFYLELLKTNPAPKDRKEVIQKTEAPTEKIDFADF